MKHYYVEYWNNFSNTYNLYWSDKKLDIDGLERITRKEAIHLAKKERYARKTDPNFAYYASSHIMPYEESNSFYEKHAYDTEIIIER